MPLPNTPPVFTYDRNQVADRLKAITIELIAAHRAGSQATLDRYAQQAGLWSGPPATRPTRLFMKLIQVFHPDRLATIMERIVLCQKDNDSAGLRAIEALLTTQPYRNADRDFEFTGFAWETHPSDFGFGESDWQDHEDGATVRPETSGRRRSTINVVEAIRREHFGNLDLDLTREDLAEMEGELELVDLDIESLSGIQLCRHLTGLNLAANAIHDIQPLRFLRDLEWLDLSGNHIEDASGLERLKRLVELDLSGNDIDDIAFLEDLPRLRLVNLSGNPVVDSSGVRARLLARGVMVLE